MKINSFIPFKYHKRRHNLSIRTTAQPNQHGNSLSFPDYTHIFHKRFTKNSLSLLVVNVRHKICFFRIARTILIPHVELRLTAQKL